MPRDITVTFDDGSSHIYNGAPDDVTPEQITQRAQKDFEGRSVTHLDGGKKAAPKKIKDPADDKHSSEEYSPDEYVASLRRAKAQFGEKLSKEDEERARNSTPAARKMIKLGDEAQKEGLGGLAKGAAEAGLSALTGIASSAAGGVLGGLRTGYNLATGEGLDKATQRGAETIAKVQQAGTYQPRSNTGQLLTDVIGTAGEVPGKIGGAVGGIVGGALGGDVGERRGEAIGEAAPGVLAAVEGLRGSVGSARQAAQRERAPIPGKDVSPLRDLSPEESARMQRMTQQGIKPTLGQVTRDPTQFRFEEQTAKKPEGAALRTRELDTNDSLIKAVEDTDKLRAGRKTTENERQTGHAIASALEEKEAESIAGVNKKYQAARDSGETKELVPTKPLESYLDKTRFRRKTVTALDAISTQLDAMKKERGAKGKLSIDDLDELYKSANELSSATDPVTSRHMADIKRTINSMTEGAGGDLYRDARRSRLEHELEFEDRASIARLIDKKSRTDYKTSTEDVFKKTVVNSSLDELKDVTTSLLDTDPKKNPKPWQAVREMQGQLIDHLLDKAGVGGEALAKGVTNERGSPTFSAPAFREAVRNIGRDKIEYLLGKDALERLYTTIQNARETKQAPGRVAGSDTAINTTDALRQAAMDSAKSTILSRVPGLKYIAPVLEERAKAKATASRIEESLTPRRASPEEIARQAKLAKKQESQYRLSEGIRAAQQGVPATISPLLKNREEEAQ